MRNYFLVFTIVSSALFFTGCASSKKLKPGAGKSANMVLVPISGGGFSMGGDEEDDEKPVHVVKIADNFWVGATEVTQEQFYKIMKFNPSAFKGANLPVETVSWEQAREFCEKLTKMEAKAGRLLEGYVYRLPTEAEWEYCCRAGKEGEPKADESELKKTAWFFNNASGKTHSVAMLHSNAWGIYDMLGNVWEWCEDSYTKDFYNSFPEVNPINSDGDNKLKVVRGGSWDNAVPGCRSADRRKRLQTGKDDNLGFRVVLASEVNK